MTGEVIVDRAELWRALMSMPHGAGLLGRARDDLDGPKLLDLLDQLAQRIREASRLADERARKLYELEQDVAATRRVLLGPPTVTDVVLSAAPLDVNALAEAVARQLGAADARRGWPTRTTPAARPLATITDRVLVAVGETQDGDGASTEHIARRLAHTGEPVDHVQVRSALSYLHGQGIVERVSRGRWRLSASARGGKP